MKLTTYICCSILVLCGLFCAVYAFSGFNLLLFLCGGKIYLFRALLSFSGVAALWLLFWLVAFKPADTLS